MLDEKLTPGDWYLFVQCIKCGHDIAFLKTAPPVEGEVRRSRSVRMTCPKCQTEHTYKPSKIQFGQYEE
jgi:hypothetical protein